MQRWEYLHLRLTHEREVSDTIAGEKVSHYAQNEAILNALGEQGWEVVGYSVHVGHRVILRRPKS